MNEKAVKIGDSPFLLNWGNFIDSTTFYTDKFERLSSRFRESCVHWSTGHVPGCWDLGYEGFSKG
jgi:hypothetical protein